MIHSNLYKNHRIEGIDYVKIQTAEEMKTEIFNKIEDSDLIVMAAAVGDFRVKTINRNKLKKDQLTNLYLEKNPDILKSINKSNIVKVGFAAESENLLENAKEKFTSKDCNIIVANDITQKNSGFGSDQNKAIIIEKNNVEKLPLMEKTTLAHIILDKAKNYLS
jgi:phosphopantothenoylcysteine decarboxylase/phosphopantothenate--cysteine ligase